MNTHTPIPPTWYMVNALGMAELCSDEAEAQREAEHAQKLWPHMGPHRAVQLAEVTPPRQRLTNDEIDDALLIAAEGQASGDTSAMALAAATLADALRTEREARQQAQIRLEREQDARARAGVDAHRELAEQMRALRAAAQAVVDRLDYPRWTDLPNNSRYIAGLRVALEGAAAQSTQHPGYLDGVNVPRLILALQRLGCATEGLEATAAALADHVNRLTRTVMSDKPHQPEPDPVPGRGMLIWSVKLEADRDQSQTVTIKLIPADSAPVSARATQPALRAKIGEIFAELRDPRQPLTDTELAQIWDDALDHIDHDDQLRFIARAIERAHGIEKTGCTGQMMLPIDAEPGETAMLAAIQPGPYLFEFSSHQDWVNRAHRIWRQRGIRSELTMCIDTKGRVCAFGRDFRVAEDEGAYPVRVFMIRNDSISPTSIEQKGGAA